MAQIPARGDHVRHRPTGLTGRVAGGVSGLREWDRYVDVRWLENGVTVDLDGSTLEIASIAACMDDLDIISEAEHKQAYHVRRRQ